MTITDAPADPGPTPRLELAGRVLGLVPLAPVAAALAAGVVLALWKPSAGAVAAALVFGLVLCLRAPWLGLPYLVLIAPLGYVHPTLGPVQAPILEAAAAGSAAGCVPCLLAAIRTRRLGTPDLVFGVLVLCIASSGLGPTPHGVWAHRLLLWASLAAVFVPARARLHRRADRLVLLVAAATAAFAEAIVAIVQYVQGSSNRFSRLGGAIVYPQPKGTLGHPNALAFYLVLSMLLVAGLALAERGRWRRVAISAAVVITVGSLVPFSRGGWIALATGFLVWGGAQRRPRRLLAAAAVVGAVIAVGIASGGAFGARISSLASRRFDDLYGFRWELARRAAHIIAHHPLTGTGVFHEIGTYAGRPTLATHPHDLVLGVAVFFGIPAAAAFVALVALALRSSWRAVRGSAAGLRAEGAGALAAVAALIVDGFFEYPFWNLTLTVLIAGTLAYAIALGDATASDSG